jgi:hypothetical protein
MKMSWEEMETIKPGDPRWVDAIFQIVANAALRYKSDEDVQVGDFVTWLSGLAVAPELKVETALRVGLHPEMIDPPALEAYMTLGWISDGDLV